jgi:tRNA threonylcarbamoyladenosine biosynthesis protein TsaB
VEVVFGNHPAIVFPMLFLAIETSGLRGSLALFAGGRCLREAVFEEGLVHGRELTARLEESLSREGFKARSLEGIAVSVGPGSYTGIRVGVTAAKSLAFALGIPVIGESSLRVLAGNAAALPDAPEPAPRPMLLRVAAVLDARQSHFFGACFEVEQPIRASEASTVFPGGIAVRRLCRDTAGGARAVAETIIPPESPDGEVLVVGDGADAFLRSEAIRQGGPSSLVRGPREWDVPRARVLGLLTAERMASARFDAEAVHSLEPAYLRVTEAERKLAAREGS